MSEGSAVEDCDRIRCPLTAAHCFDDVYVGKQLIALEGYCGMGYIVKDTAEKH